jgi:hypothetical protein
MKKPSFLVYVALIGSLIAANVCSCSLERKVEQQTISANKRNATQRIWGIPTKVILPVDCGLDIDTGKIYNPNDVFSASKPEELEKSCDLFLRHTEDKRRIALHPANGARMISLGVLVEETDLDSYKLSSVGSFSDKGIAQNKSGFPLTPGSMIAFKTNGGNYATMRIGDEYLQVTGDKATEWPVKSLELYFITVLKPSPDGYPFKS